MPSLEIFRRSDDTTEQEFIFPTQGHLYDIRQGRYMGQTNQVRCAIPNAGTIVFGQYPYQVTGIDVESAGHSVRWCGPDCLNRAEDIDWSGRAPCFSS